jgi:hypothetical protein
VLLCALKLNDDFEIGYDVNGLIENVVKAIEPEESEEEDDMSPVSLGSAIKFLCEVSVVRKRCDSDLLSGFVEMMPLPRESGVNESILNSFLEMAKNLEFFGTIHIDIVKLFVDILLNHKDIVFESEGLANEMKEAIKNAVMADSRLEREITRGFSRQNQNHFRSLLK